jgi:hypothetical protein
MNHCWVIAANERVNNFGVLENTIYSTTRTTGNVGTPDGSYWIDEFKYSDYKERWINGGPEISHAYHFGPNWNGPTSYIGMVNYFYDGPAGLKEQWRTPQWVCAATLCKRMPGSSCTILPNFPTSSALSIIFFERDFRKRWDRTHRTNPNNAQTAVTFGSEESPYGTVVMNTEQTSVSQALSGFDVRFGYGLTNSGSTVYYRNN